MPAVVRADGRGPDSEHGPRSGATCVRPRPPRTTRRPPRSRATALPAPPRRALDADPACPSRPTSGALPAPGAARAGSSPHRRQHCALPAGLHLRPVAGLVAQVAAMAYLAGASRRPQRAPATSGAPSSSSDGRRPSRRSGRAARRWQTRTAATPAAKPTARRRRGGPRSSRSRASRPPAGPWLLRCLANQRARTVINDGYSDGLPVARNAEWVKVFAGLACQGGAPKVPQGLASVSHRQPVPHRGGCQPPSRRSSPGPPGPRVSTSTGCRGGSASKEVCCHERSGSRPPPMNRRRAVSPPQPWAGAPPTSPSTVTMEFRASATSAP